MKVLTLILGDRPYGLPINLIREILEDAQITRVERAPDDVEGLMNVRGQIITVLKPSVSFQKVVGHDEQAAAPLPALEQRVIVLKRNEDLTDEQSHEGGQKGTANDLYAFAVDGIEEVSDVDISNCDSIPSNTPEEEAYYLTSIARIDGKILPILHVKHLIQQHDQHFDDEE